MKLAHKYHGVCCDWEHIKLHALLRISAAQAACKEEIYLPAPPLTEHQYCGWPRETQQVEPATPCEG
eukprot:1081406-Amphidinium_carterae.1